MALGEPEGCRLLRPVELPTVTARTIHVDGPRRHEERQFRDRKSGRFAVER